MSSRRRSFNVVPGLGREGGSSALSLPYLKTFEEDTIGQAPVGWVDAGYTGTPVVDAVVAATFVDNIGYTPAATKCLQTPVDATNTVAQYFALPGTVDISDGFRFAAWLRGDVQQQANQAMAVMDRAVDDGASAHNGIRWDANTVPGQADVYSYGYTDGAPLTQYHPNPGMGTGFDKWFQVRVEWNPVARTVNQYVLESGQGFVRHTLTGGTPTWQAALTGFNSISHLWVWCYKEANVYCRDTFYTGFWLGRRTDDWPSHQMPLSL